MIRRAIYIYNTYGPWALPTAVASLVWRRLKDAWAASRRHWYASPLTKRLSYETVCLRGGVKRPWYGYVTYTAGAIASALDLDRISILEFGVANGDGLRNLEQHAERVESELDVSFELYGFDTGEGLPEPVDYRDIPYRWSHGEYAMDETAVREKLSRSTLILGDVKRTLQDFYDEYSPAPVGGISFDLDFYSSTTDAFEIFECSDDMILPRVPCYLDDVAGIYAHGNNRSIGQLRAIDDFNRNNDEQKVHRVSLNHRLASNEHIRPRRLYMYHRFEHPEYDAGLDSLLHRRTVQG